MKGLPLLCLACLGWAGGLLPQKQPSGRVQQAASTQLPERVNSWSTGWQRWEGLTVHYTERSHVFPEQQQ